MITPELEQRIKALISQHKVVLFMKGTPEDPQCGFSTNAIAMLIESDIFFESFNIYSDEEIRQGLKQYSSWPTFPQLYINGELIGGVDIMTEMYDTGEFKTLKEEENL